MKNSPEIRNAGKTIHTRKSYPEAVSALRERSGVDIDNFGIPHVVLETNC